LAYSRSGAFEEMAMSEAGSQKAQELQQKVNLLVFPEEVNTNFLNETLIVAYKLVHNCGLFQREINQYFS
jgi:hypothetical protein